MQAAIDQFRNNMQRVQDFQSLYTALVRQVSSAVELDDILRATLVMAVSALDHFVHEVVRLGMMEIWIGKRPETPAFRKFSVSIASARLAASGAAANDWLAYEIVDSHGWR